jgi:hypothetical protein
VTGRNSAAGNNWIKECFVKYAMDLPYFKPQRGGLCNATRENGHEW